MRVLLGSAAKTDLEAESNWYAEIHPDLARDFLDEVRKVLGQLGRFPQAGLLVVDSRRGPGADVRRWSLQRFPFTLVYVTHEVSVTMIAVAHDRRSPASWSRRLPDA